MNSQYIELTTGTMCQIDHDEYVYPTYSWHNYMFVNVKLLKQYMLARLFFMNPIHTVCNEHHSVGECPGIENSCKHCASPKHNHPLKFETLPPCPDMTLWTMAPFLARVNTSDHYIANLEGEYFARNCAIYTPAKYISNTQTNSFIHYGVSPGNYLLRLERPGATLSGVEIPYAGVDIPYFGVEFGTTKAPYVNTLEVENHFRQLKPFPKHPAFIFHKQPMHLSEYDSLNKLVHTWDWNFKWQTRDMICPSVVTTRELLVNPINNRILDLVPLSTVIAEDIEAELQMDESDGIESLKEPNLDTKIDIPQEVNLVDSESVLQPRDIDHHDQAIETTREIVGINSSHTVSKISTPSGFQEAIDLSVVNGIPNIEPDFVPKIKLPDYVNRWQPITPILNIYSVNFNDRVKYFINLFKYFHSMIVWKIVSKPPLFQSQRFWVAFNPTINGSPLSFEDDNDLTGFEWNPSENNEIYVITPWSSIDYMDTIDSDSFGRLLIKPRTDIVTELDLPTPLPISVYCAPLSMCLFQPQIVSPSTTPSTTPVTYVLTTSFTTPGTDFLTRSLTGNPSFILTQMSTSGNAYLADSLGNFVTTNPFECGHRTLSNFVDYKLNAGGTAEVFFYSPFPFSVGSEPAVAVEAAQILEIATDTFVLSADPNRLVGPVGKSSAVGTAKIMIGTETFLSEGEAGSINVNQVSTDTTAVDLTAFQGVVASSLVGTIQMKNFGHVYNPNSVLPKSTYGYTGDHTSRVDNQWGFIASYPLESDSTQIVVDVNSPSTKLAYFDRDRHLLYHRYPLIKFTSASNPSTNLSLRITQIPTSTPVSFAEALQLPAVEWDLKQGAKILQPYWDFSYIAKLPSENSCFLQIDVIGGTIGTTPFVSVFYNTAKMEFFHLVGYDPSNLSDAASFMSGAKASSIDAKLQMDSVSMVTPIDPLPSSSSASRTEHTMRYVQTITIPSSIAAVTIPVNARLFGPWNAKHLGRYGKYRGNLKVKVMVTSNRLINGNIHVIHHNGAITGTLDLTKSLSVLGDIGYSVDGAPGSSIELKLDWRTRPLFLPIDFSSNTPDNGYLSIVIPATSSFPDTPLVLTLYSDVSGIEVDLPRSVPYDGGYEEVTPETISRS